MRTAVWDGLFRNSALALVCRVVTALSAFCIIPFIISRLGIAGYGVWETLIALGGILFVLQNIISNTLLWWMSQAYGRGDHETLYRSAGIGLGSLGLFFLVTVPAVWLAREPLTLFINVPAAEVPEVARLLAIYVAVYVAGGVNEILAAMVTASQRMGEALVFQTAGRLMNYGCAIGLLLAGHGMGSLVAGSAIGSVVYGALLVRTLRRLYPGIRFRPLFPSRREIAELYRYTGFMFIISVVAAMREQADKIILAAFASPTWVGYYGIALRLASLLLEFNRFFFQPLIAASGALQARGDRDGVCILYRRVVLSVAVCTGMVFIGVMGGYDRIMSFWLGSSAIPQVTEMLLLLVLGNSFAVILAGPQTSICRGIGRAGVETVYVLFRLLLDLALTVLLVTLIGAMGTVYATAASRIVGTLLFTWLFHHTLQMPVRWVMSAVGVFAVALLLAGVTRGVFSLLAFPVSRGESLLSFSIVVLPACGLYLWALVLSGIVTREEIMSMMSLGHRKG